MAAILYAMDPVSACSQKIWPDTSLAFFMVLSVYLFLLAKKNNNAIVYILSGIAGGIAVNIKYPGRYLSF